VTLYFILSPQEQKKRQCLLDALRGNMSISFISNNNVSMRAVTLAELYVLTRTLRGDYFFMTMSYLSELTRNEMNHLLLETDNLVVVTKDDPSCDNKKIKWFKRAIKQQTYPNLRYSMPYVHKMIGLPA